MRIGLLAVGRMKAGPERDLLERYLSRARSLGRGLGVQAIDVAEVDEGRGRSAEERKREEASALSARVGPGSVLVVLDERGRSVASQAFAEKLGGLVEQGAPSLVFAFGGPDGVDETFRARAAEVMSFGAATLPHQLVRVLLAEQLYRAFTILAHHPYHRA